MRKGNLIRIVRTSSGLFWIGRLTSVSLRGAITFSLRGPRMVTFTELGVMAVVLVAHQPGVLYLARVRESELMESKSRY